MLPVLFWHLSFLFLYGQEALLWFHQFMTFTHVSLPSRPFVQLLVSVRLCLCSLADPCVYSGVGVDLLPLPKLVYSTLVLLFIHPFTIGSSWGFIIGEEVSPISFPSYKWTCMRLDSWAKIIEPIE